MVDEHKRYLERVRDLLWSEKKYYSIRTVWSVEVVMLIWWKLESVHGIKLLGYNFEVYVNFTGESNK